MFGDSWLTEVVTEYDTTRLVKVKSQPVAIASCILFVLIWSVFLGSIRLDVEKIYKRTCPVRGSVLTKVKGLADTRGLTDSELNVAFPAEYRKLWDSSELVHPVEGGEGDTGSFTVVTNLVVTPNQTLGSCADGGTTCSKDGDCVAGRLSNGRDGVFTGKCDNSSKSCVIEGWCPPRSRILPLNESRALFASVANFTVFLKNSVEFPDCAGSLQGHNIASSANRSWLSSCSHKEDKSCPIFRIADVVEETGVSFEEVAVKGAVFRIGISWKCDFDSGRTAEDCAPTYEFSRVDDSNSKLAKEHGFWAIRPHSKNYREARKMHGLKILINLEGEGRKSDFFVVIIQLGAIMGFFSVKPLICDYLVDLCNAITSRWAWGRKVHKVCDRFGDDQGTSHHLDDDDDDERKLVRPHSSLSSASTLDQDTKIHNLE